MFAKIRKRDGREVNFDEAKITEAIFKAAKAVGGADKQMAMELTLDVLRYLKLQYNGGLFGVEDVQDVVEKVLIEKGHAKTAKAYILYRNQRTRMRDAKSDLMDAVAEILVETSRENANVSNSPSAKMLQIASAASKSFYLNRMIPENMANAHKRGDFHIHDLDFYGKTLTCVPDFEYTLIRDSGGNVCRVSFNFFNELLDQNSEKVKTLDGYELLMTDSYQVFGRTGWTKINKVMRRMLNPDENLFCINLQQGRPLHLTGKHKIPVLRDGQEVLLMVKDVIKGDSLFLARQEYTPEFEIPVLDMFVKKILDIPYGITIANTQKLICWLKNNYDDFNFRLLVGDNPSIKDTWVLDGRSYAIIADKYYIPYEIKKHLSLTVNKEGKSIPAFLPMSPELCRLLGYILAEGHMTTLGRSVAIVNYHQKILRDIDYCVAEVFNDKTTILYTDKLKDKQKGRILTGSIYIALLQNILGFKENAIEMDVPEVIFNTTQELKAHFLHGLFDGYGHLGPQNVSYETFSERFAQKLIFMLQGMGINTSYQKSYSQEKTVNGFEETQCNYNSHIINILDGDNLTFLDQANTLKDNLSNRDYIFTVPGSNLNHAEIVSVEVVTGYDRYVFDLETTEHWFTVNDYIVHNCVQIPFRKIVAQWIQ